MVEPENSTILLVEDEETLAEGLIYNLKRKKYSVTWAQDGKQALEFFESENFDLIILDIMLPFINGFDIAKVIQKKSPQMPILILTARTSVEDKVHGLEIGADDYLTKPFHLQELLARVKVILKRKSWYKLSAQTNSFYRFGNNEINFSNLWAKSEKREMQLTQREAMVMKYLIDNRGKIISRKELLEKVWDINTEVETRTVDNFIARLRKYFEPAPRKPVYIKSVRSAGYIFMENPDV